MILGRLGRMAYINTLPVDWGLAYGALGDLVEIQRGTPTVLNRLLAEAQLDLSPVSSVAAAEHAHDWLVLDSLGICSRAEVGSVILKSDRPVAELDGHRIAVTGASATARKLLEVLLNRYWDVSAELVSENVPAGARLLIGDAALLAAYKNGTGYVYDLGRAWHDFSGGNFVFGLWCIRKTFVEQHPEKAKALYHLLQASYALGRIQVEGVMAEAGRITGLSPVIIKSYYQKLVYKLDDRLWAGLTQFLNLAGYEPHRLERYPKAAV